MPSNRNGHQNAASDGPINLLIVDQHVLFREGLESLLASLPGFQVVGQAATAHDAIEKVVSLKPDLVLMDYVLPDASGPDALRTILARSPQVKVVIMALDDSEEYLFEALRSGARGFMLKDTPIAHLIKALGAVQRGETALTRHMTTRLLEEFRKLGRWANGAESSFERLTVRESEVLRYLASGASNREIAQALVISEHTVKAHVRNILDKLQLRNRSEAAGFARRNGLASALGQVPASDA
jgi:DNA-binding NarL/FixJ family response regulator